MLSIFAALALTVALTCTGPPGSYIDKQTNVSLYQPPLVIEPADLLLARPLQNGEPDALRSCRTYIWPTMQPIAVLTCTSAHSGESWQYYGYCTQSI